MSTFELFLQLPLFKGLEKDDLFSLIPKINLDFETFQPGQILFDRTMDAEGLVYLLAGKVRLTSHNQEKTAEGPLLLSYTGLFGEDRQYLSDATAMEACQTLNIDTKSLLYMLRNCPEFMSNYLDLLSDTIHSLYVKGNDLLID